MASKDDIIAELRRILDLVYLRAAIHLVSHCHHRFAVGAGKMEYHERKHECQNPDPGYDLDPREGRMNDQRGTADHTRLPEHIREVIQDRHVNRPI